MASQDILGSFDSTTPLPFHRHSMTRRKIKRDWFQLIIETIWVHIKPPEWFFVFWKADTLHFRKQWNTISSIFSSNCAKNVSCGNIWSNSHLLKKSLMKKFIFCAVSPTSFYFIQMKKSRRCLFWAMQCLI